LNENWIRKNSIDSNHILESVVFKTIQYYFVEEPSNLTEMKDLIQMSSDEKYFLMVSTKIRRTSAPILRIEDDGIVMLFGDSSMTAHYRLGVGINTILDQFDVLRRLFRRIGSVEMNEMSLVTLRRSLLQSQVIFLESYCDLLVFFDFQRLDIDDPHLLQIYHKNNITKEFNLLGKRKLRRLLVDCVRRLC